MIKSAGRKSHLYPLYSLWQIITTKRNDRDHLYLERTSPIYPSVSSLQPQFLSGGSGIGTHSRFCC